MRTLNFQSFRNSLFSSERQFYTLNVLGWAGYGLSSYLGAVYWGDTGREFYGVLLLGTAMGLFLSFVMRPILQMTWEYHVAIRVLTAALIAYLCSLIWIVPYNFALWAFIQKDHVPANWTGYFWGVSRIYYIFLCWICLYFGIKFYKGMQEAKQRALILATLAQEAQLKMLRYQLNPHFLFNTLNTISTLILDQQNLLATEMLTRLSKFLRYSLESDALQKVSLEQELEALNLYLNIEKVRFGKRLRLHYDIEDGAYNCLIPSLILQPITENAIKYAVSRSRDGGTISVSARRNEGKLYLSISDDGPGLAPTRPSQSGTGVGLKNTVERLREFYGSEQSFEMVNSEPQGLQVNITIPEEV